MRARRDPVRAHFFYAFFRNNPERRSTDVLAAPTRTRPTNTMTYFPHHSLKRPAAVPAVPLAPARPAILRDVLWNQPVFKAPALPSPRIAPEPLPFTAARVTRRSRVA
jgi:hypothetical protein